MENNNMCLGENNSNLNIDNTTNPLVSCFFSLPPKQYAILSSLLGILLVENLDLNQQNSLGNFLVGLGSSMLTAAAQGQLIESNSKKNDPVRQQLQMIKKQICVLEQKLD